LALLNNASVRKSREVFRQYSCPGLPGHGVYPQVNPVTVSVTQDIPCVEVQIPESDWRLIVQLIEAHERAIRHPSVQDAWDQYLMITHLTKI